MNSIFLKGLNVTVGIFFFLTLGILLFPFFYPLALLRSFAVQILLIGSLLLLINVILRKWNLIAILLFAMLLVVTILPKYTWNKASSTEENINSNFIIAHYNVLKINWRYAELLEQVGNVEADVISFQEIDSRWKRELLEKFKIKYPYSLIEERDDSFYGLAVFSKHPITHSEIYLNEYIPTLDVSISIDDKIVNFIFCHTRAPIAQNNFELRNTQMKDIALKMQKKNGVKFIVGDFNAVPWDCYLENMLLKTKMKDSRSWLTPTYPSHFLYGWKIPIDFIFHNEEVNCTQFESIQTTSDHYGVRGFYKWSTIR